MFVTHGEVHVRMVVGDVVGSRLGLESKWLRRAQYTRMNSIDGRGWARLSLNGKVATVIVQSAEVSVDARL